MYYVTNKDIKLRQRPPQFISLVCILCVESVWDRTFFFKLMKYKRFKKLRSLHLHWKFKLFAGKFTWGDKAKHCLVMSTDFLFLKVCWQRPSMFCLYKSSKLSLHIWIFTECEGDGIESRLPFNIFSTLSVRLSDFCSIEKSHDNEKLIS